MTTDPDLALFLAGIARFNAGDFYEAHERWEDLWLRNRSAARPFYQGLIQAAAAFHHLQRGKPVPASRLLVAATERLAPFGPVFLGVAVGPLLVDLARADAHAGGHGPAHPADHTPSRPPTIAFEDPDPEAFRPHRGTEPRPVGRRREPDVRP